MNVSRRVVMLARNGTPQDAELRRLSRTTAFSSRRPSAAHGND